MKKITIVLLAMALTISLGATLSVEATDFEGQEDKYMQLCASSTLSSSNEKVCKDFNSYLKNKNKDLKKEISDTKTNAEKAKSNLEEVEKEITNIKQDISSKETEIEYLDTTVKNLEQDIEKKELEIRDRLYAMQSYVNSNTYIDFIFGASNFSDMFSRISSVNELTAYDKTLIQELADSKKQMEDQQKIVADAKANLDSQRQNQETLQNQYLTLYQQQNADIIAKEKEALEANDASEKIDDNLAAFAAASKASEVTNVTQATPPSTPSVPNTPSPNENTGGNPSGGGTNTTPPITGDYTIGLAIANAALTRQGCPYVWAANGPNSFDCSGLVLWACQQAGLRYGDTTAAGWSGRGTAVSYANLQAGDIITFKTDPSYVSHIGIYIGNGQMVHAPTFGIPVQVVNINTKYWQNVYYNARRLY